MRVVYGLLMIVFYKQKTAYEWRISDWRSDVCSSDLSLFNLQERGRMMAEPSDEVYEGQIVGIHSRDNDLVVNPLKGKKLTNMRASGSDENVILVPAVKFALEPALEFINDDEQIGRAHV